jgi:hypothetical protein
MIIPHAILSFLVYNVASWNVLIYPKVCVVVVDPPPLLGSCRCQVFICANS